MNSFGSRPSGCRGEGGAGLLCEDECLGDGGDVQGDDDLVGELCRDAGADWASMDHGGGDGIQHADDLVEDPLVAADHDRQGAVDCLRFTAADRGVEHGYALLGQRAVDLAGGERGDRAHVDEDEAGACGLDDSAGAKRDLLHLRRVRQHGDHQFDLFSNVPRTGGGVSAETGKLHGGCRIASADDQLMPGLHQVLGHWLAHDVESDESDLHNGSLSFRL